jgi:hypothetical protein
MFSKTIVFILPGYDLVLICTHLLSLASTSSTYNRLSILWAHKEIDYFDRSNMERNKLLWYALKQEKATFTEYVLRQVKDETSHVFLKLFTSFHLASVGVIDFLMFA